jgi:acetyl-CoA carboxylase biotin carboxylase subunit/3-methylcrotonyl-CoA carboxylase alpha subunit
VTFRCVLVANRGEIARRVMRTCKRLGIRTVAVHSDADRGLAFVEEADEAFALGGDRVQDSYLDLDKLRAAISATSPDAVHPGYGMLSEDPRLARLVQEMGAVFLGPSPEALAALGDKIRARRLARAAGLEPPPGSDGAVSIEQAREVVSSLGFPVMVKAASGGGGIGMQRAASPEQLEAALGACASRAKAAFADSRVYIERALEHARHIEVQAARDTSGASVCIGERECSAQRRHQKVLEECPSPAATLSPELRARLYEGACRLLDSCDYQGVATIEFLVTADDPPRAHFLEVNARIQVEHPTTELVYDVDIVELQLLIAAGQPLASVPIRTRPMGHAIEVRLYAEDPEHGFLPQPGTLTELSFPESGPGVRIESCYRSGELVTPYYDPMIAKLICHGPDRPTALATLARALDQTRVELVGPKGPKASNVSWLRRLIDDPRIQSGDYDTGVLSS